jgi:hypothetical protein
MTRNNKLTASEILELQAAMKRARSRKDNEYAYTDIFTGTRFALVNFRGRQVWMSKGYIAKLLN